MFEQAPQETKAYIYGLECLGEEVTETASQETEWRYYQRDGNHYVRQTSNNEAEVTFAWTFSPQGAILLGERGPVTHLTCEDNAVYDWSTGLIYQAGRYFDPATGIWLSLTSAVVWQLSSPVQWGRKRNRKEKKRLLLFVLLLLEVLVLTGCGPEPAPTPTCTPTLTPTQPPLPTETHTPPAPTNPSSPTPSPSPSPTPSPMPSPTPPPTYTPTPTETPIPGPTIPPDLTTIEKHNPDNIIWTQMPIASWAWKQSFGNTIFAYDHVYGEKQHEVSEDFYSFSGGFHGGFDLGADSGTEVLAGTTGYVHDIVSEGVENNAAVYIVHGDYLLKYQHILEIPQDIHDKAAAYDKGERGEEIKVSPNTQLGETGPQWQHVHVEMREGSDTLHSPILYFSDYDTLAAQTPDTAFYQNEAETIPWTSVDNQPTLPQNPGYLILERYFGVVRLPRATPTP